MTNDEDEPDFYAESRLPGWKYADCCDKIVFLFEYFNFVIVVKYYMKSALEW